MFLDQYGLMFLILFAAIVNLWVLIKVLTSIKEALRKYDFPFELYEKIKSDVISQAFIGGRPGDGWHIRHVISGVVTAYSEQYPAVEYHRDKIFEELENIDFSSFSKSYK